MNLPENLKYTKDHEWCSVDGDVVTIGVTDFAQSELGDIVFVEIETEGEELEQEEVFGRSEEHTSELQSRPHLVCRLLLEKKKNEEEAMIDATMINILQ